MIIESESQNPYENKVSKKIVMNTLNVDESSGQLFIGTKNAEHFQKDKKQLYKSNFNFKKNIVSANFDTIKTDDSQDYLESPAQIWHSLDVSKISKITNDISKNTNQSKFK